MENENSQKRAYGILRPALTLTALAVVLLITGLVFRRDISRFSRRLFSGDITRADAKAFMQSFGWHGMVVVGGFSMLQVVLTFLPAEPVQVVAGMSYGLPLGVGLCMAGVFVGNNVMFLLSRTLGTKLTKYFKKNISVNLTAGGAASRISFAVLILYILPAIPYGLICFMAASTGMKYRRYILLTTVGSLPSVVIGAALGVIAIETGLIVAAVTLVVLVTVIIVVFCLREKIFVAINRAIERSARPYSTAHKVRKPNAFIYRLSALFVGGFVKRKVKISINKTFKRLPRPAVVLCNHPSFVDWVYAALAVLPDYGNFIIARYYYFQRKLAWLVKQVGTIPKSMFTVDIESARNAFRVVKEGGILCLMPEARLSTAGKTEEISDMSAKMLCSLGAPVYTVKIDGAYLAKPKWGKGFRKGALVQVRAEKLADADEVRTLSSRALQARIEDALAYDDFVWLETHPEICYKSKRLAEGLENVLLYCPDCGGECTLTTAGHTVSCAHCGFSAELDGRYTFVRTAGNDTSVPANPQIWYAQNKEKLRAEIAADPAYTLEEHVRLKIPDPTGKQFFIEAGVGVCRLTREGFSFTGTVQNVPHTLFVPQRELFRLLFGAGENFEIYDGKDYYYFIPPDVRSCVKWYVASEILHEMYEAEKTDERTAEKGEKA